MSEIYLYHHLGMGDHITCHGLVRWHCQHYNKVNLFVKESNYKNVRYMYNDIENINLLIGDDNYAQNYLLQNKITNVKIIGFNNLSTSKNLELQFYEMAGLPIDVKWNKFHINRNIQKEKEIFNQCGLEEQNYIFIHKGDYELKNEYIPNDVKVVEPKDHGLFDWIYVIENAKEIHCIDSSFLCLVDCMKLRDNINLYNHRYVRDYPEWIRLYTNKKWKEIK
jgi:hypothetical protein